VLCQVFNVFHSETSSIVCLLSASQVQNNSGLQHEGERACRKFLLQLKEWKNMKWKNGYRQNMVNLLCVQICREVLQHFHMLENWRLVLNKKETKIS